MATQATNKAKSVFGGVNGYWEPSLSHAFWPGCACGEPHPMAKRNPSRVCLKCGEPVAQNAHVETVPGVIVGWSPTAIFARLTLAIGKALIKLANKV